MSDPLDPERVEDLRLSAEDTALIRQAIAAKTSVDYKGAFDDWALSADPEVVLAVIARLAEVERELAETRAAFAELAALAHLRKQ